MLSFCIFVWVSLLSFETILLRYLVIANWKTFTKGDVTREIFNDHF